VISLKIKIPKYDIYIVMHTNDVTGSFDVNEGVRLAAAVIQELEKAKKLMHMYPSNNPVYAKALNAVSQKFDRFFELTKELALSIDKYELTFNKEPVYHNQTKDDNLALFFFKDGVRLLSFRKGLTSEEIEDFVKILNIDFDAEAIDDDVVTLLWERDFDHIKHVVDENFLSDWEMPEKGHIPSEAIKSAHADGINAKESQVKISIHISDVDYQFIEKEIEEHQQPKIRKVATIFFEALHQTVIQEDQFRIMGFVSETLVYCVRSGDFNTAASIMENLAGFKLRLTQEGKAEDMCNVVYATINSEELIHEIADVMENNIPVDSNDFLSFIGHYNASSIPFFTRILGEVQMMKHRRLLIEALTIIGRQDIKALAAGLKDDMWYVARNTAIVLGNIAAPETVKDLAKALTHKDHRVRKEVVKAIGNTGSPEGLEWIQSALIDENVYVRNAAAKALCSVKTDEAKKLLLKELSTRAFLLKDFNEKKEFMTALASWQDQDVFDFMIKTLNRKKIFKKAKNEESRACAAYALGMMQNEEAIPHLEKACNSKNMNLRRLSSAALRKLKG
jgi:hypothetical protein